MSHSSRPSFITPGHALTVVITVLTLSLASPACRRIGTTPAYPLYPNAGGVPASRLARLSGPIASVDGQDVGTKGNSFDLLPGCHIVVLQHNIGEGSSSGAWAGNFGRRVYAFKMRPAHLYTIRPEAEDSTGPMTWVRIIARERPPEGRPVQVPLARAQSDIDDCRRWARGEGF
jgi:hypothetical protein